MRPQAIVFLEIQFTSYQIADYVHRRGYAAVVLTANPDVIPNVRDPYRQYVTSIDDIFMCRSWFDRNKFLEDFGIIREKYDIAGIYARSELCLEAESILRSEIGQRNHNHADIAIWLDKYSLREALRNNGLSKLLSIPKLDGDGSFAWPYNSEFYFKPRRGTDSVAVTRCKNEADLRHAEKIWEDWLNEGDGDIVNEMYIRQFPHTYLEEVAVGEHISIEAVVSDETFIFLGLTKRSQYSKNSTIGLGFVFPYEHARKQEIIAKTQKFLSIINFKYGAVHIELIVPAQGEIEIIDFNPRLIGSDVMRAMNVCFDTRIEAIMEDIALGKSIEDMRFSTRRYCESRAFFVPDDLDILEDLRFPDNDRILDHGVRLPYGTKLSPGPRFVKDIAGSFMVYGDTPGQASAIADDIQAKIVVNEKPGVVR